MTRSILIVDDEPMTRNLLRLMLKGSGFEIDEAEDGMTALEKVQAHKPDVMLLDVMMPGVDGLTVCKRLRADAETADLPIVILSAKTTQSAIQAGLDAGANLYLTKPVRIKNLLESIQSVVGKPSAVP